MNIDDLKNLPTPAPTGWAPGVEWDGATGHITVATKGEQPDPKKIDGVLDSSPFLGSDEVMVDWSARPKVTVQHDDAGNLVRAWYRLTLVQKPKRGFDVDSLIERIHTDEIPHHTPTSGWRTILVADTHIGKGADAGGGSEYLAKKWIDSVTNALQGNYEGVHIAFGGDLIEGYVSNKGQNIPECDLTITEQQRVAQHLVLETIHMALDHANRVVVSVVPGNHSETTRVVNRNMDDNWDIQIVSNVQFALDAKGEKRVTFYYPERNRGDVVYEAGGDVFCLVHGHKFSGQIKGAEKWLSGQVMNGRDASAARVMLCGHFHNMQVANVTADRWIMFGPALEHQSSWLANVNGASAKSGVLAFDMKNGVPVNIGVY